MRRTIFSLVFILILLASCSADSSKLNQIDKLISMGMYDEAVNCLKQEIVQNPTKIAYHLALGRVYLINEDDFNASNVFARIIALDPKNQLSVGREYLKVGKFLLNKDIEEKNAPYSQQYRVAFLFEKAFEISPSLATDEFTIF